MKCDYGCGNEAKYKFKNGKKCCSLKYQSCPSIIKKTRKGFLGKKHTEETKKQQAKSYRKGKKLKNIYDCSSRTTRKILTRLNLQCSICGWDKGICDIHHINGKKIENPDNHDNLSYICPNCHRLIHENKIKKKDIPLLCNTLPKNWRDFYYSN